MSDDTRPIPSNEPIDPAVVERLREEVTRLRLQIGDEIRTRRIVVVDESGLARIRFSADGERGCSVALLDPDGFERAILSGSTDGGALRIAARPLGDGPARVDVFALDPEDDAGAYVGLELIDDGNTVAGVAVVESREPRTWTAPRSALPRRTA